MATKITCDVCGDELTKGSGGVWWMGSVKLVEDLCKACESALLERLQRVITLSATAGRVVQITFDR